MANFGRMGKNLAGRQEPQQTAAPDDDDDDGLFGLNEYDAAGMAAGVTRLGGPVSVVTDVLSANKKLATALEKALEHNPAAEEKLGCTPEEVLAAVQPYDHIYNEITKTAESAGILSGASLVGGGAAGLAMGALSGSWLLGAGASLGGGLIGSTIGSEALGIGEDNSKKVIREVFQLASNPNVDIDEALQRLNDRLGAAKGTSVAVSEADADEPFDNGLPPAAFARGGRGRGSRDSNPVLAA